MEAVGAAASILALVELAAKTVSLCAKYSTAVKNANKGILRLQNEVSSLEGVLKRAHELCSRSDGSRLLTSKEAMESLAGCLSQLDGLYQNLKPAKRSRFASAIKLNELKWPLESKYMGKVINDIERYKSTISIAFQIDQIALIQDMLTGLELDKLPSADGAAFDSFSGQLDPRCHEQTRVELRRQIRSWVDTQSSKCIFWLNGAAGTGKSTISRTVAQEYSGQGFLGASFFFKRGEGDRGNATRFFTTIAAQLVRSTPLLRSAIKNVVQEEPDISGKSMREQFDKLLLQPLKGLEPASQQPLVIVIDALDECENSDHVKHLIHLLSQIAELDKARVRIFLTSRPELPIRLGFGNIPGISYQGIVLHEIPASIIRSDLIIYIRYELSRVQAANINQLVDGWPGEDTIEKLVTVAEPLFISAATICRFIGDHRFDPEEQIKVILKYKNADQLDQLATTYQPVLDALLLALNSRQRERLIKEFRTVVGTILVAADSLSISSLAALLNLSPASIVRTLSNLHSVLEVSDDPNVPIRLFHLSFRDYLVDVERANDSFMINESEMHGRLASACVRILVSTPWLKQDICDLDAPGVARREINNQVIGAHLPPVVQYACRYWTYHLERSAGLDEHHDDIPEFLEKRVLYWIEALSLIGRSYEILGMIEALQQLNKKQPTLFQVDLIQDIRDFVHGNESLFDSYPLQIYSSGLLFSPKTSNLRELFDANIPPLARILHRVEDAWEGIAYNDGHTDYITYTIISPDAELLASTSYDHTVKVWDVSKGNLRYTLYGHTAMVLVAAFSSCMSILASGCNEGEVKIWNLTSGGLITSLTMPCERVLFLDFSSNDAYLLATGRVAKTETLTMWDTEAYDLLYSKKFPTDYNDYAFRKGCFSNDNRMFALSLSGREKRVLVRVLETRSGDVLYNLVLHGNRVEHFGFSPDDNFLMISIQHPSITGVYDMKTGLLRHEIGSEEHQVALSRTGSLLATLHRTNNQILIWRTMDLQAKTVLEDCEGFPEHPARHNVIGLFSQDEKHLAVSIMAKDIRVWDVDTGDLHWIHSFQQQSEMLYMSSVSMIFIRDERVICLQHTPQRILEHSFDVGHVRPGIQNLMLSPDGKLIACIMRNHDHIELWNAITGRLDTTLAVDAESFYDLQFSSNGTYLSLCSTIKLKVWEMSSKNLLWTIEPPFHIELSPDGRLIAAMHSFKFVEILETATSKRLLKVESEMTADKLFAFAIHNSKLALAYGSTLQIWSIAAGRLQEVIEIASTCHADFYTTEIRISSNGNYAVASSARGEVAVIDLHLLTVRNVRHDGSQYHMTLRLVADSFMVVCACPGQLQIWDITTLELRQTIEVEENYRTIKMGKDDSYLQTDRGKINIKANPDTARSLSNIFFMNDWITINMVKHVWLPLSHRPVVMDACEDKIVMGFASGRILLFDCSADPGVTRSRFLV